MSLIVFRGMQLRDALRAARLLGLVAPRKATGEVTVFLQGYPPLQINNRRKDAPLVLVRRLQTMIIRRAS